MFTQTISANEYNLIHENNHIKKHFFEIQEENYNLRYNLNIINYRITKLELQIADLVSRDEPITVREAMITLEQYIMLDILGSKKRIRGHTLTTLFSDPNYVHECQVYLDTNNITKKHIHLIASLKRQGNKSAHEHRPILNRADWDALTISMLEDPTNLDDIRLAKDLLKLSEKYSPVSEDGKWIIKKPW